MLHRTHVEVDREVSSSLDDDNDLIEMDNG